VSALGDFSAVLVPVRELGVAPREHKNAVKSRSLPELYSCRAQRLANQLLQELHIEFSKVLDDTVKPKRRRLQEGVLLALITHVTEERLIQSRRVELDEPGAITGQLKSMRSACAHVQKIARPQGYMFFACGHTHASVQTEEGFRVFLMQSDSECAVLWAHPSSAQ
jgi:hypothetical protein